MADKEYNIQELVHRDVYVNDKKVGTIVGERHHPNEARVQSMRIQVESDVADEYMRKPAELAPLPKELVHSIQTDGTVKLSKSMRELQRRWRNTIRTRLHAQKQYGIEENIRIPLTAFSRTRERLDEIVLSRTFDRVLQLPSYIAINDPNFDEE